MIKWTVLENIKKHCFPQWKMTIARAHQTIVQKPVEVLIKTYRTYYFCQKIIFYLVTLS
jgi:hypothetical protein